MRKVEVKIIAKVPDAFEVNHVADLMIIALSNFTRTTDPNFPIKVFDKDTVITCFEVVEKEPTDE